MGKQRNYTQKIAEKAFKLRQKRYQKEFKLWKRADRK